MIINGRKKLFNLTFLLIFLTLTLFVNFFHTEEIITDTDNCPACQFQCSSVTTGHINFFFLPPPQIAGNLEIFYSFDYQSVYSIDPVSRSPPKI